MAREASEWQDGAGIANGESAYPARLMLSPAGNSAFPAGFVLSPPGKVLILWD